MAEVIMPRLSDTMEEGELAKWLKDVGDPVKKGDVLAEIETDKATMDLEAFEDGVLEQQLVESGTVVAIGTPVAVIGTGENVASGGGDDGAAAESAAEAKPADEDVSAGAGSAEPAERDQAQQPSGAEAEPARGAVAVPKDADEQTQQQAMASSRAVPDETVSKTSAEPGEPEDAAGPTAAPVTPGVQAMASDEGGDKLRMSPLARKLAKDNDVDLSTVRGTGPQGRIVRADVEAAIEAGRGGAREADRAGARPAPGAGAQRVAVSRIRQVAAKRLTESQAVPHFFLTVQVNADRLFEFRSDANQSLESSGVKLSVNDLLVKAAGVALRRHPEANASWDGDAVLQHDRVNVGIAVATDNGLLVPVVADADRKSLGEIAADTVELAQAARDGKLKLDQMSGGTFSISNLGMFGIEQFTAVINPPEAAILAVGASVPVPTVRDGQLVEVPKMKLTLTVDHRVMDGAVAAVFLRDLVGILENPLQLVL